LLFILGPIAELYVLIKVGSIIGVIPTVALVLLTTMIGSYLVKRQGLEVLSRVQSAQARGEVPALPLLNGIALFFAGVLLIVPGFISDALGFVLLIPRLREYIARTLLSRIVIITPFGTSAGRRSGFDDGTIEGEYRRKSNSEKPKKPDPLDHDHW